MFEKKKSTRRVLIVEDDALLAQVLGKNFSDEHFEVKIVGNGLDALDEVKKFQPAMILLDLILPGIDGFAVLTLLKSDEKTKNIPVVVVSNLGDAADVKSVKALGAVGHFIKANTDLEKIVDFVKSHLHL